MNLLEFRLYNLGTNVDRRRGMNRGEVDNGHRKMIFPIRDTEAYDVFIRELSL